MGKMMKDKNNQKLKQLLEFSKLPEQSGKSIWGDENRNIENENNTGQK